MKWGPGIFLKTYRRLDNAWLLHLGQLLPWFLILAEDRLSRVLLLVAAVASTVTRIIAVLHVEGLRGSLRGGEHRFLAERGNGSLPTMLALACTKLELRNGRGE